MTKRDPALLQLVREAFVILNKNSEVMASLLEFVEEQQKKTEKETSDTDYSSSKSIYLKQDSDL
jgi:hypothetical protein